MPSEQERNMTASEARRIRELMGDCGQLPFGHPQDNLDLVVDALREEKARFARQLESRARRIVPVDYPRIVVLCGSSKFKTYFEQAMREETLKSQVVIGVGMFGHIEGLDMDGPVKKMLDELHFRKIDICDEIFVINPNGYIGESTRNEIAYAKSKGKDIRYMFPQALPDPVL